MSSDGASNNERLLSAARYDNHELLQQVFKEGKFDINYQDGIGNTALHYAAQQGSTDVLEDILSHDECDVDPINRLDKATPLHLALTIDDKNLRLAVVESLLDAGADTTIRNRDGDTVLDLVRPDDVEIQQLIRKARAQASVSRSDIVNEDDDEPGSGSGSGSDDE